MAYVEIKDVKNGLDTRRPAIAGEPGTLVEALNMHITRGGDLETSKAFVPEYELPAGTFGFHPAGGKAYVFGSDAAPVNLPGEIVYQRLEHPSAASMTALVYATNQDGKVYAIAEYEDGSVYHFYNGTQVTGWETLAATLSGDDTVATYLASKIDILDDFYATPNDDTLVITAANAGAAFTIAVGDTGTGTVSVTQLQANQAEVPEVRAVGSFEITDGFVNPGNEITAITADGTSLIDSPVAYVLSNAATALSVTTAINVGTHGYFAEVDSLNPAKVNISAPEDTGATANGDILSVTPGGFVTVGSVTNFAGGVTFAPAEPQIEEVTIGGTFDDANTYTITINGTDYKTTGLASAMSRIAKTFQSKMYTALRALLVFSEIEDPTVVTGGADGQGSLKISNQDEGSTEITAIDIYQNLGAIFTANTVQIWFLDADPANNTFRQLLSNTGTRSPRSVKGYGNLDLMYLSDTGIRSLRARDSSNAAFADDIGTRIDSHVLDYMETVMETQIRDAITAIDPKDGRPWMALGGRIYVFSYFPGSKVSAWTYVEPGFNVDHMAAIGRRLYLRSGDTVYVYGGRDGNTYPDSGDVERRIRLPFVDAKRLAGWKQWQSIDIIAEGQWTVELLVDPRDESLKTSPLVIDGPTCLMGTISVIAHATHIAPVLTTQAGGKATISSIVIHFEDTESN